MLLWLCVCMCICVYLCVCMCVCLYLSQTTLRIIAHYVKRVGMLVWRISIYYYVYECTSVSLCNVRVMWVCTDITSPHQSHADLTNAVPVEIEDGRWKSYYVQKLSAGGGRGGWLDAAKEWALSHEVLVSDRHVFHHTYIATSEKMRKSYRSMAWLRVLVFNR